MEIVPFLGDQVITASEVSIDVNPEDRRLIKALVERTSAVTEVSDELTFSAARRAAGELKAKLDEIEAGRKAAKQGFDAVGRAIQDLASDVSGPVKNEQNRILGLLNTYVHQLELARQQQQQREAEARRKAQAEADLKVREAQEYAKKAEEQLRKAQGEIEQARHREELQRRENRLLQEQLARDLAADVEELGKDHEPPPGLVPGGRVDHKYDFELESIQTVCAAGLWRLVRWELDIRACQDAVKSQLEGLPELEPKLPGIRITKRLSVSVKAVSRIK